MKKMAKLTTLTVTAGLLLASCGDGGDPMEGPMDDGEGLEDLEDFDDGVELDEDVDE